MDGVWSRNVEAISKYEHPSKPGKVTVAGKPGADVPKGTAANILRQAGLRRSTR
jgi:hypothetical protein